MLPEGRSLIFCGSKRHFQFNRLDSKTRHARVFDHALNRTLQRGSLPPTVRSAMTCLRSLGPAILGGMPHDSGSADNGHALDAAIHLASSIG